TCFSGSTMLGKAKTTVTSTFAESERKKGGRPKKPEGEHAKENRFATYFSPSELAIVESAANSYGMTVGKFIKMATVRMARLEK
ncbi:hypothetical protein, partial [Sulfurospirillum sp. SCADC]|uniref:hypothetical protein n=1 Tax=Sulfurospirillum sp. SCADC TaxID=1537915 RepID=UPI0025E301E4